jgi:lysophospholipase
MGRSPSRYHHRYWPSRTDEPLATLLCVHGLSEHSGRYARLADAATTAGIDVLAVDLAGHGRSTGRRGHIHGFEADHYGAVDALILAADEAELTAPRVLLGHSLGGLIALRWMQDRPSPPPIVGLVLVSPWIESKMRIPPWKRSAARVLAGLVPQFSLPTGIPDELLFRDPAEVADYGRDPLVQRRMTARHWVEVVAQQRVVARRLERVDVPTLVQLAGDDRIVSTAAAVAVADGLPDARLHEYEGAYHALHADRYAPGVFQDLVAWVRERVAA